MLYINKNNLSDYAFVNTDTLKLPLKAVCVCFHGYTDDTMYEKSNKIASELGKKGIAWVFPYYSVWGWLGKNSIEFCEQVIDAAYEKLNAPKNLPLIATGGSMGGLTALMYCILGKRKPVRCAVDCPVTDMHKVFTDNVSMRRAILSAHIEKSGNLEGILKDFSPVYRAKDMPEIPYFFVFGEADNYITENHYPPIKEAMEGRNATFYIQEKMGHCQLNDHPEAIEKYCKFIIGE